MRAVILKYVTPFFLSVFLLTTLIMSQTQAQAAETDPPLPAPIQALVADGAQVRYLGGDLGMNGYITMKGGQEQ